MLDIELPPLRRRGAGDILSLAEHFAVVYGRRYGKGRLRLGERARRALTAHQWPGNVRELEHAIERAVVFCDGDTIDGDALGLVAPERVGAAADAGDGAVALPADLTLDDVQRRYAAAALERAGGNRSAAARALGISRNRLARLLAGDD